MIDDLTRNILEQRDNIENQRNREIKSNEKSYTTEDLLLFIDKLRRENKQLKEVIDELYKELETIDYDNFVYTKTTLKYNKEKLLQILDKVKENK